MKRLPWEMPALIQRSCHRWNSWGAPHYTAYNLTDSIHSSPIKLMPRAEAVLSAVTAGKDSSHFPLSSFRYSRCGFLNLNRTQQFFSYCFLSLFFFEKDISHKPFCWLVRFEEASLLSCSQRSRQVIFIF